MFNFKKAMSLAMAGAMVATMAVPAFAEDTESTTNRQLKIDGAYQAVPIDVVVPSQGTVIINPYALPVEIVAKTQSDAAVKVEGQQIVTKPLAIKNKSEVKLDVNVTATATVKGALTLAAAPIDKPEEDTKNEAFVYLTFAASGLSGDNTAVTDSAIATEYKDITWNDYAATGEGSEKVLALSTKSATKAGMATLAKSDFDADSGEWTGYAEGSIAYVGLTGTCAQNPKTAWTAKDGLTATIAFTFTPNVAAAETEEEP
jgi:hypothetical protein